MGSISKLHYIYIYNFCRIQSPPLYDSPKLSKIGTIAYRYVVGSRCFVPVLCFVFCCLKAVSDDSSGGFVFHPVSAKNRFCFCLKAVSDDRFSDDNFEQLGFFKNPVVSGKPHPCTPLTNCPLDQRRKDVLFGDFGEAAVLPCFGAAVCQELVSPAGPASTTEPFLGASFVYPPLGQDFTG